MLQLLYYLKHNFVISTFTFTLATFMKNTFTSTRVQNSRVLLLLLKYYTVLWTSLPLFTTNKLVRWKCAHFIWWYISSYMTLENGNQEELQWKYKKICVYERQKTTVNLLENTLVMNEEEHTKKVADAKQKDQSTTRPKPTKYSKVHLEKVMKSVQLSTSMKQVYCWVYCYRWCRVSLFHMLHWHGKHKQYH